MPAHHTSDSESLSLPTPTTQNNSGICRDHGGDLLHDLICGCPRSQRKETLLRTPAASEGERGHQPASKAKARGGQQTLSGQFMDLFDTSVSKLFRTPQAKDGEKGGYKTATTRLAKGRQVNLYHEINELGPDWGKFEPAIRRWEGIIGRPAPEPTKPDGKEGNHRLSSKFTEWMMGLPDGWITDIGLKRNDELKACGNGVVPQQAELALSLLGINQILEAKLPERKET
jgi:hypothetical protein